MKKRQQIFNILALLFIFLLMIELGVSIEITLTKDNYSPFETLQAGITGNFVTLSNENINIYEEGVPRSVVVVSGLTKQQDIYYYYATLPNKEGNYTFVIENTQYISEGEEKSQPIIKKFTITKSNLTSNALSINPGFIFTNNDFSIKITSPFKNQNVVATLEATNQSRTLNLIESQEETIDFKIANINQGRTNIRVGNYVIPVFILNNVIIPQNQKIVFTPSAIVATITPGQNYFFKVFIENYGDSNLTNLRLSNDLNASIKPETFDLKRGERKIINITIPISQKAKNNLTGKIIANYLDKTQDLYIFFNITTNQSKINLTGTTVTPDQSCLNKGKICVYPEKCTRETTDSIEGPCCLGDCSTHSPPADYGWVFGVILLALLAVLAFFMIKKARKKQKLKTTDEMLDEKSKRFTDRMNPKTEKEVSGKLGRI